MNKSNSISMGEISETQSEKYIKQVLREKKIKLILSNGYKVLKK